MQIENFDRWILRLSQAPTPLKLPRELEQRIRDNLQAQMSHGLSLYLNYYPFYN